MLANRETHLLSPGLCCLCVWSHLTNKHLKALPEQNELSLTSVPSCRFGHQEVKQLRGTTELGQFSRAPGVWPSWQSEVGPALSSPRPCTPPKRKDRNLPVMFFLLCCNYDSLLKFPIFNWVGKLQSWHRGEKNSQLLCLTQMSVFIYYIMLLSYFVTRLE